MYVSFSQQNKGGEVECSWKRGRLNMKFIDSVKETMAFSLQDLSKAVNNRDATSRK